MKQLPLFCLLLFVLASCQNTASNTTGTRTPKLNIPPVPSARELAQDTNWIPCDIKADWVYLENAPAGYKYADWVPLLPGSYEWNKEWVNRQPRRKFANGPGRLWLRKENLSLGTMFKMDNDLLEVTGDWHNGRLIRAVKIRGEGELAQRQLNWDAINAGLGAGVVAMSPFVWTGAKMVEAITTPTSNSAETSASINDEPKQSGPVKVPCSACSGRGGHSPGYKGALAFGANFQKCPFCDGTGRVWVR